MKKEFISNDLIYNRFDLIYKGSYVEKEYCFEGIKYIVQLHIEDDNCKINVWDKYYPQKLFDEVIEDIFMEYPNVLSVEINWGNNNYDNRLIKQVNYRIDFNENGDSIIDRIGSKERKNLRRKKKKLLENTEGYLIHLNDIEQMIPYVDFFFKNKMRTHGRDYGMNNLEYLNAYYITDMLAYINKENILAVIFFNVNNNVAYFENFTYSENVAQYSPGYLIYIEFLLWCEQNEIQTVYLAGGQYEYKKKFNSIEIAAYKGEIYNKKFYGKINDIFNEMRVRRIAFYGAGKVGHEFCNIIHYLDVDVVCGIDKKVNQIGSISILQLTDNIPDVDLIVITVVRKNIEIEQYLNGLNCKYVYWFDLIKETRRRF